MRQETEMSSSAAKARTMPEIIAAMETNGACGVVQEDFARFVMSHAH